MALVFFLGGATSIVGESCSMSDSFKLGLLSSLDVSRFLLGVDVALGVAMTQLSSIQEECKSATSVSVFLSSSSSLLMTITSGLSPLSSSSLMTITGSLL